LPCNAWFYGKNWKLEFKLIKKCLTTEEFKDIIDYTRDYIACDNEGNWVNSTPLLRNAYDLGVLKALQSICLEKDLSIFAINCIFTTIDYNIPELEDLTPENRKNK
jgi:hypothetical protein